MNNEGLIRYINFNKRLLSNSLLSPIMNGKKFMMRDGSKVLKLFEDTFDKFIYNDTYCCHYYQYLEISFNEKGLYINPLDDDNEIDVALKNDLAVNILLNNIAAEITKTLHNPIGTTICLHLDNDHSVNAEIIAFKEDFAIVYHDNNIAYAKKGIDKKYKLISYAITHCYK